MGNKLFILGAILCLCISSAGEILAQCKQSPRKKSSSYRYFKRSDKLSIIGGVGSAIMNSDNLTNGFEDGLENMLRQNGLGPTLGIGVMYQASLYVAVRGDLNYVGFNSNLYHRQDIDVPFRSNLAQVSGSVVVNLLDSYIPYRYDVLRLLVPYVKGGIGMIYYNATSFESGNSGFATVIPVGVGVRLNYSRRISFAPELTLNYTTTDYLDNLERAGGFTGDADTYINASVNMIYTISKKRTYNFHRGR